MNKIKAKWLAKEDSWANIIGLFLVFSISIFWFFDLFFVAKIFHVKFSTWHGINLVDAFSSLSFSNFLSLFCFFMLWFGIVSIFLEKIS